MALSIVHEPPSGSPPQIDVVAVHGLNFLDSADPSTSTWERDGKLWIRDFLPSVIGVPCRVMLYHYNSSPAIGASAIKLDDHARKLLLLLRMKRKGNAANRSLIFICHSLGGILVKEALVEATLDESYKDLLKSTRVLVFFGTPHQGGRNATVGDYAADLYRAMTFKPRNDLVDALKADSDSASKRFEQFRHKHEDFQVISCFEGRPYSKAAGIIVDKRSATLNLPGKREKQVPIDADHSGMCKFAKADDPDCETVMALISDQLELASVMNVNLDLILAQFDYSDRETRLAQVEGLDTAEGTLAWIWDSPLGDWMRSSERIMWLRGKAASGKSTLINYIAESERTPEELAKQFSNLHWLVIRFFFDFRLSESTPNTIRGMLLSILHSLVSQSAEFVPKLKAMFIEKGKRSSDMDWNVKRWNAAKLFDLVGASLDIIPNPILILVDGLDEFTGDSVAHLELSRYLERLSVLRDTKICFASRPHPILDEQFGTAPCVPMELWNKPGLLSFVETTFASVPSGSTLRRKEEAHHLAELLAEMSEGVFAWLRYALIRVVELWTAQDLEFSSILLELGSLPKDVEGFWDQRRAQQTDDEKRQAGLLLRLICSAAEPLSVSQIEVAWVYHYSDEKLPWPKKFGSTSKCEKIQELSCGLLEPVPTPKPGFTLLELSGFSSGPVKLKLVHKSVRRYLNTRGWWHDSENSNSPEYLWLQTCVKTIDASTTAGQRALCYRNAASHDAKNRSCRRFGCYPEVSGMRPQILEDLDNRDRIRSSIFSGGSTVLLDHAFHWLPFYSWSLQIRRKQSPLDVTKSIMCPELIYLMHREDSYHCSFCETKPFNGISSKITYHGATAALDALRRIGASQWQYVTHEDFFVHRETSLFLSEHSMLADTAAYSGNEIQSASKIVLENNSAGMVPIMLFDRRRVPGKNSRIFQPRNVPQQRRVAVVGSRGVGRSQLVVQYLEGHFVESYYPTVGNTFSKVIERHGQQFHVEFVDTAGQDEYTILNSKHFIGTDGYMIVYSVKSKQSFELVRIIRDKILNHLDVDRAPIMIVGNIWGTFNEHLRQVTKAQGKALAEELDCGWIEADSRYNENVSAAFEGMIDQIEAGGQELVVTKRRCELM